MSKSDDNPFKDAQGGSENGGERSLSTGSDTFRVGMKVPPFYAHDPQLWFAQIEGHFVLSGITVDNTKFHYALSYLDAQYAKEVRDIIISPPTQNKFETLKNELIKRLCDSREKEVKQLLTEEELGDRKPSQFLRHLKQLAGTDVPESFLKSIWTSRLPMNMQTLIASQPLALTLESLAELADRIKDLAPNTLQVASTSRDSAMDGMAKQIAELTKQVQALASGRNSRPRSNQRANNHFNGRSQSHTRSESSYRKYPVCWYHSKFGEKSTRCIKPCDYHSGSGNPKGSR